MKFRYKTIYVIDTCQTNAKEKRKIGDMNIGLLFRHGGLSISGLNIARFTNVELKHNIETYRDFYYNIQTWYNYFREYYRHFFLWVPFTSYHCLFWVFYASRLRNYYVCYATALEKNLYYIKYVCGRGDRISSTGVCKAPRDVIWRASFAFVISK